MQDKGTFSKVSALVYFLYRVTMQRTFQKSTLRARRRYESPERARLRDAERPRILKNLKNLGARDCLGIQSLPVQRPQVHLRGMHLPEVCMSVKRDPVSM